MIKKAKNSMISLLAQRDEASVALFLNQYWAPAYRLAYQLTGDPGAAEDLAQETFVSALNQLSSLKDEEAFRAWFFKILTNKAKSHQRSSFRRAKHELSSELSPNEPQDPGIEAQNEEHVSIVRAQLNQLPPKLRNALVLRYFDDLSLAEVATILDIPRKTVSSRIRLGLESLKKQLEPKLSLNMSLLPGLVALALKTSIPRIPATTSVLLAVQQMNGPQLSSSGSPVSGKGALVSRQSLKSLVGVCVAVIIVCIGGLGLSPAMRTSVANTLQLKSLNLTNSQGTGSGLIGPLDRSTGGPINGKSLRVQLIDGGCDPVPGISFSLAPVGAKTKQILKSDAAGEAYVRTNIRPGRYQLRFQSRFFESFSMSSEIRQGSYFWSEIATETLFERVAKKRLEFDLTEDMIESGIKLQLLGPTCSLKGLVLGPNGKPLTDAKVFYRSGGDKGAFRGSLKSLQLDSEGRFQLTRKDNDLDVGGVELIATHEKFAYDYKSVELSFQQRHLEVTLAPKEGGSISGRLQCETGAVTLGSIQAIPSSASDFRLFSDEYLDPLAGRRLTVDVNAKGEFFIGKVPPGYFDLIAIVPGRLISIKKGIKVVPAQQTKVDLWAGMKGEDIQAHFFDESGKAVKVSGYVYSSLESRATRKIGVTEHKTSLFDANSVLIRGLEPGSFSLDFHCYGYLTKKISHVTAGDKEVRVSLKRNCGLELTITSPLGKIREFTYSQYSDDSATRSKEYLSSSGVFKPPFIGSDLKSVKIEVEGHRDTSIDIEPRLRPGEIRRMKVNLTPLEQSETELEQGADPEVSNKGIGLLPDEADKLIATLEKSQGEKAEDLIKLVRKIASGRDLPGGVSSRIDLIPVFKSALQHQDEAVRIQGVCALWSMNNSATYSLLMSATQDPSTTVQYYALCGLCELLEKLDDKENLISLFQSLTKNHELDIDIRIAAARPLLRNGLLQDDSIVLEALRDPDSNIAVVSELCVLCGRKDILEMLIRRMHSTRQGNDTIVGRALVQLTGQNFGVDAGLWMEWLDSQRSQLPKQLSMTEN